MLDYDDAVARLRDPATWCDGARDLAALADPRGLVHLLRAFESRAEVGKRCLLDAMDTLAGADGAARLCASADTEERRLGALLMELVPKESHLATLATVIHDGDARVRGQALDSLACQKQTPEWEALMIRLLDDDDRAVRGRAVEGLARRKGDAVKAALAARAAKETDAALLAKLRAL